MGKALKKTPLRVLIVEDSADDTELVLCELARGGYEPRYERIETPEAMRRALAEKDWGVIISDHDTPRFSTPAAVEILQDRARISRSSSSPGGWARTRPWPQCGLGPRTT